MQNYIIAYDIFDTKRLNQTKKIVYSYSIGGQKSAIEAPLNKNLMQELVSFLDDVIKDEDKINIIKTFDTPILLGRATQISYENNGVIIL